MVNTVSSSTPNGTSSAQGAPVKTQPNPLVDKGFKWLTEANV